MPIGPRDDIDENAFLKVLLFPGRVALYLAFMALFYPIMLLGAFVSAIYIRVTTGTAATVLHSSLKASFKTGASYPCIFVFKKPLSDQAKLVVKLEASRDDLQRTLARKSTELRRAQDLLREGGQMHDTTLAELSAQALAHPPDSICVVEMKANLGGEEKAMPQDVASMATRMC